MGQERVCRFRMPWYSMITLPLYFSGRIPRKQLPSKLERDPLRTFEVLIVDDLDSSLASQQLLQAEKAESASSARSAVVGAAVEYPVNHECKFPAPERQET